MLGSARNAVSALLLAAAPCLPVVAHACSCTNNLTLDQEFAGTPNVFSGIVTQILPQGEGLNEIVTLTPLERWKGGLDDPMQVVTALNTSICGYPFQVGVAYLVFATPLSSGAMPWVDLCRRTAPLDQNPYIGLLPAPVLPVPAQRGSWGRLKAIYR